MDAATEPDQRGIARHAIEQVLFRYCRGVDRADWTLMRSAFHDDATDDHGSVAGSPDELVAWTANRHRRITQSMHSVTNIGFVEQTATEALVESYCTVRQTVDREAKPPVHLSIGCRYIDVFEHRAEWRISRRTVRYEWVHKLHDVEDLLVTSPDLIRSSRDGSDPVQRLLEDAR